MQLRVIDFFCGAGGFSEGFRQQGFEIVMGIDNWKPAVQTHNLNHNLNDITRNVLEFENDIELINALPNTEIIIGSPPCVNFSMSNRAGKADKSLGVRLIEAYLRVVAVKKHQPNSILQAWLMENVPNSRNFVQESYTFADLNLGEWAKSIGLKPTDDALRVKDNGGFFTASDYGSPQSRQRFICGEIVSTSKFPEPMMTHGKQADLFGVRPYITLGDIKQRMPSPISYKEDEQWQDPNYPNLVLRSSELSNHFYDTGLYAVEWEKARFFKVNHPFMGRMSFPEDENKPGRTVMATRSASTREALIFKSERNRKGDGEYRLPTIREVSTLMGFPYTYQFVGGEGTKWRLIGNAVCPHMAAALAKEIRKELDQNPIPADKVVFPNIFRSNINIENLNNPKPISFNAPPKKKKGAKFRMHPFKDGNMTVSLTNFNPNKESSPKTNGKKWYCSVFLGSGKEFTVVNIPNSINLKVEKIIKDLPQGSRFMSDFKRQFKGKIGTYQQLQTLLESNLSSDGKILGPISLIEEIAKLTKAYDLKNETIEDVKLNGFKKDRFPKKQLFAIWAIGQITLQK
jgi:DNA (cytosine-5)-methyltransferase 1